MAKPKARGKYKLNGYKLFVMIVFLFSAGFSLHFFRINKNAGVDRHAIDTGLAAISAFDYENVSTVEDEIRKLEKAENRAQIAPGGNLTSAQYKQIFTGDIIIGDSITSGLTAYGYLAEEQVFCKIGASLLNGDELFRSAASTYPVRAFISFGINDILNYRGETPPFIERYTELINKFRSISPGTEIFINSITAPTGEAVSRKPNLGKYAEFNEALKEMCGSLPAAYIDNTHILADDPDLHEPDGIHVKAAYYPLWLDNMISKAGM